MVSFTIIKVALQMIKKVFVIIVIIVMDPPKQEDKKQVQGGFTPLPPQDCTSNPNQADPSQQQPKHPSSTINILTPTDSLCVTNNSNNHQIKQASLKQYKDSQLHSQSMLNKKIADVVQKNVPQMKQADKHFNFVEDGEDVATLVMLRPVEKMPTNLFKDEKRPKLVCIDEADNFKASLMREIKKNIQDKLNLQALIVRNIEQLRNEIHKTSEDQKLIVFTRRLFPKEQIEELQVEIFIIFCQLPLQKLYPLKKGLLRYVSNQQELIAIIKQHKIEKQLPNFLTVNPFQIGASNLLMKVMHSMLNQNISKKVTAQILNHFKELVLILGKKSAMYEVETSPIFLDNFIEDVKAGRNIIEWYTTQQPFYKILNNLLRSTRHPAQSYYVQPYFKKLYQQIQKMFKQAVENRGKKNFTCYRGCFLTLQQIQHYTKNIGEVIISLGFLSTSIDQAIAKGFGNSLLYIKVDEERISEENCPGYASISSRSNYWLEKEVLFNPLNSFMITAVTKCKVTKKDIIHLKYGTFSELIQCKSEEELMGTHYYHFKTSDRRMEPKQVLQQAKMMKSIAEMQKEESQQTQCEGDTLIEGNSNLEGCEQYWWRYKDINEKCRGDSKGEELVDIKLWGRLAKIYKNKGEYDKSLQFYEQSRKIKQKKLGKQHVDYATTLNNMAAVYQKKGEYDKSLQFFEQSRKIQQKKLGKQHVYYATTLNNMAAVYQKKGEYDKSLQFYEQSRKIKQKKLGKQHVDYATTLNNMAAVYQKKGEYDKSLQFYEQSRKIKQKKLGKQHVDYATTLNNMAAVYQKKGEYDKSLQFYEESREIQQKKLGKQHVDYATTLNNMGLVYQKKGEYDKSLQFYEQSRKIQQKKLGKQHVDYATTLNNMGLVYQMKGEYDKSLQVYEQSREIQQKKLGKQHVYYAMTLNNMAAVYYKKGEYDKSLQFYEQSRKIRQKKLGKQHVDYATTLNNMGLVYQKKGEYDKSLQFYEQSRKIKQKKLGKQHVYYAMTLNNMAAVYYKKGEYDKSLQFYEESREIQQKKLGKQHVDYAMTLNNMAVVYKKKGEYDKSLQFYEQSRKIHQKKLGKQHVDYAATLNNMAVVYQNKGEYDKSLQFYEQSRKIQQKKLGKEHVDYAVTLYNIGSLYYTTGKYDKSLQSFLESKSIYEKNHGIQPVDYAYVLTGIGSTYQEMAQFHKAAQLYQKSLLIVQKCLGSNHRDYKYFYNKLYSALYIIKTYDL